MRTTTLLLTAALGVVGSATTMAAVYSVNAVGYVNTPLKPGFNLIANPLDNKKANSADELFAGLNQGLLVWKFTNGLFENPASYDAEAEEWTNGGLTVPPGVGVFVQAEKAGTVTFVGEVMQGTQVNKLKTGFNMVGSIIPQGGLLMTDLLFPKVSVLVYTYDPAAASPYTSFSYDPEAEEWSPSEPTIGVGQGFWAQVAGDVDWSRSFSVNTD